MTLSQGERVTYGGTRGETIAWCSAYSEKTGEDLPEAVEALEAAREAWRDAARAYRESTSAANPEGDREAHLALRHAVDEMRFWEYCAPVTVEREQRAAVAELLAEERAEEAASAERHREAAKRRRAAERELDKLRAREDAHELLRAERLAEVELPEPVDLGDLLAEPSSAGKFLIDGLWPSGGKVLLAAPAKGGKSTIVGNLLRSLVDGVPLFDAFDVTRRRRVALLDFELSRDLIREWLSDQEIENTGDVTVVPMLGRAGSFGILDASTRTRWADLLRGHDVLVLDPLRPVLHALGLKEATEVGPLLQAFDALRAEAEIPEGLVVQHMGHGGERAAGDSNLIGWPDAVWNVTRETPTDPRSFRFFSAYGRDVDVDRGLLSMYDGRRLAYAPEDAEAKADRLADRVLAYLAEKPRSRRDDIIDGVHGLSKNAFSRTVDPLVADGRVVVEPGEKGAKFYSLL
ncbi:AAA family ATPase [Microbacterium sp. No. 7]|uniref:AAA family ATPase n=1 Tax=Microbacterium sp. No. 7 TaxID=1714373 RepID=UPI0006D0AE76|nr:AAA family ATPase [Microbacterium sp. No. 7]ALJ20644.1 hypothetical protein AOA12_12335 [Microbacterium sp. No. 7]